MTMVFGGRTEDDPDQSKTGVCASNKNYLNIKKKR